MMSRFEGWISLMGLPFNMWNKRFFDRIGNMFDGMIDIDQQTKVLSPLNAAKIKVKKETVAGISHVIHQKFGNRWLILHL